ncbi:MAG: response regulator transcription factor [Maribacter sp.]|nr:response regulator transcription factor [Maribacter sp.]NNK76114.1 response regulator transcription factor [Maribacter sp.]
MKADVLKIIVIDNDVLQHEKYNMYFEEYNDFSLEGVYCSIENAILDYANTSPDIIILEVNFPFLTGIQSIRTFQKKDRHVKIMMISDKSDFELIKKAFKNGANGYLTKPLCKKRLLRSLNSIKYEGAAMSRDIVQKVVSNFQIKSYNFFSERENQIIDQLCRGATYKIIADKLFVTTSTINFHIQNIYLKLNVNSKSEALLKLQEMD